MRTFKIICTSFAVAFAGCTIPSKLEAPRALYIDVYNPTGYERAYPVVSIQIKRITERYPSFNPEAFYAVDQQLEVASQVVEKSIIVALAPLKPHERRTITFFYSEAGSFQHAYQQRAHAELSHKVGGEWKGREYIGGAFQNIDSLRVPGEHKDHSWYLRYEGPGWESDLVGYRLYLDQRNAVDVFGKTTHDMVLAGVGQDGFDSYHQRQPWGMDIMKVGKSLGLGSIGMWVDSSAVRVEHTDSVTSAIQADGPIYSSIRNRYYGWKTKYDTVNLVSRLGIFAGQRFTVNTLEFNRPLRGKFCTGVVKDAAARVFQSPGSDSTMGFVATWGKQSLARDQLGLVVFFEHKYFAAFRQDQYSHIVEIRPDAANVAVVWFAAAWEQEPGGIKEESDFISYLEKTARELAQPVVVSLH